MEPDFRLTSLSPVLVANRGEIAVRIMATLRRLGVDAVAVYTDEDRLSTHVRMAGRAERLSGAGYLDVGEVMAAVERSGARAVHPGYGFLSENPSLARACEAAGVVFIGPPADAIELMGDKINAKRAVAAAGVAVVPGRDQAGLADDELAAAALDIGLPVLLKPAAGGGGKGMRRVDEPELLPAEIAAARREARAAFGSDTLLVERYITRPRHIEVQVFADRYGATVALGERECSLQRRHQKIVEEAPSPLVDEALRIRIGERAVAVARACGYVGAGTVEFIVSADRPDEFWFMEMNTRLQVEHPVTEMVLDLDLVEWQLRVAAGQHLPWEPDHPPQPRGHSVEARIYAEDPSRGFLPSSGPVLAVVLPAGMDHVRVDSALAPDDQVGTRFDPMIAKVVAWGEDRTAALTRLSAALAGTQILGLTTNTGFLSDLIVDDDVVAGNLDTALVERVAPRLAAREIPVHVLVAAALLEAGYGEPRSSSVGGAWDRCDGWRISGPAPRWSEWRRPGNPSGHDPVRIALLPGQAEVGGEKLAARAWTDGDPGTVMVEVGATVRRHLWARDGDRFWLADGAHAWSVELFRRTAGDAGGPAIMDGSVTSPMPGTVLSVYVQAGSTVTAGQPLVSVEAMKMEHVVRAPFAGSVAAVEVRSGQSVRLDQVLARVEPEPTT